MAGEEDRELYALLHLSPQASDEDIRRAYRQWAQVYHPDKHHTPQMQGIATENFQRVREAYEILSDERKRMIYDLYGMEGLNSGLELGPKLKTVDEDELKGFEESWQHRRVQQMSKPVQHSGSLLVDLSLAEMFRSLNHRPVLRGMTSSTEVQTRLSKRNSLVLGGNIAFRQQMGGGTLLALFRHQISSEADLEVLAMIGMRSLISIQTSRQLSSHATGGLGLSLSLVDGAMNLTNTWTRELSDSTRGNIQLVIGTDAGVSVGWQRQGQRNSGFGEVKIGQFGVGVTAQYNHGFSAHSQGRIVGRLAGNGVEVEIGGERRISSHSALAMFCTIGLHGISYRFRFSRGGQKFIIPILLTPNLNPLIAVGALLIPSSFYAFLKAYLFKPYFLKRSELKSREKRRSFAAQVNVDTFKLTGDTLRSVQEEPDEEEEMLFAELYKELMAADTRSTRARHGRGCRVRVGRRGVAIHRATSTTTSSGEHSPSLPQVFMRQGSSSSHPIAHDDMPSSREPEFDDNGNLISEGEPEDEQSLTPTEGSSSENSLDEHFDDGANSDSDDSESSGSSY